ncbi:unnamed protein product, partial [Mesorhabditis belari]|uniref:Uncharacterized protein n=1 Tax=Mesorhabditis belari TaxID=2138241 RepID=A0AAF3FBW3_9BILA
MGLSPVIVLLVLPSIFAFSCKDQNNKDVDWFAVYKMPIEKDNTVIDIAQGLAFYYLDVNDPSQLRPSAQPLNSTNQAIANTLNQFYAVKDDKTIFHVMFNDEPYGTVSMSSHVANRVDSRIYRPELAAVQFGHTKGTLFFDGQTGVWLVHSVPKFPPPDHYQYPDSGTDYGQTMLCMTFTYAQLKDIGTQLFYNHPDIYSSNLPTSMASANPDLANLIAGKFQSGANSHSSITLTTKGGQQFKSFAKTADFNDDLYQKLLAPSLRTPFIVESWRRGSEVPLTCGDPFPVNDALTIKVGESLEFKYTKDHSKLARSALKTSPYVCIGDINRMTSQYVRGGGTTCISNDKMWNAFNVITTQNQC